MKFMVSILLGLNLLVQGTVLPASSCFIPNVTVPLSPAAQTDTAPAADLNISAPSAILMEAFTGAVVYEKNSHEARHPASVTKIMTLLLIFDALSSKQISLDDTVTVSEYAASMGGSQVFLEPGETQTVETMIKCICFCQYKSKKNLLLIRKKHHCFHPVMLLRTILFRLCFFFFVENVIHLPAYLHTTWFINKDFLNNL